MSLEFKIFCPVKTDKIHIMLPVQSYSDLHWCIFFLVWHQFPPSLRYKMDGYLKTFKHKDVCQKL